MKTERLALRVSDAFLEGLDELTEAEDLNRAEVVWRAVALYAFARKEAKEGEGSGGSVSQQLPDRHTPLTEALVGAVGGYSTRGSASNGVRWLRSRERG
jgi:hypothetical protein